MINFERVSDRIFKVLKGHGYNVKLYSNDGMDTVNPEEARRFYVDDPNLMITLDEENGEIIFNKNANVPLSVYESSLQQIKNIANHYMLNFTLKEFGKKVEPKDFSYQAKNVKEGSMNEAGIGSKIKRAAKKLDWKMDANTRTPNEIRDQIRNLDDETLLRWAEDADHKVVSGRKALQNKLIKQEIKRRGIVLQAGKMESVTESSLSKMFGSKKTSRQTLEDVQLLVRHKKPVDEEVRGSRTRNIQSIFLECNGERFRFPHNNLAGARAMARHMQMGGQMGDTLGEHIVASTGNYIRLREFMRYVRSNKLLSEDTTDVVQLVKENMTAIAVDLKKLAGTKTYNMVSARIAEQQVSELNEEDTDKLRDMFTVKRFDEKYSDVLPLVSQLVQEKETYLKRIEESADTEITLIPQVESVLSSFITYETKAAELGNRLKEMSSRISENTELASYVSGLGDKMISEQELTEFEQSVLSRVLQNSSVQHTAPTGRGLVTESSSVYNKTFDKYDHIFVK